MNYCFLKDAWDNTISDKFIDNNIDMVNKSSEIQYNDENNFNSNKINIEHFTQHKDYDSNELIKYISNSPDSTNIIMSLIYNKLKQKANYMTYNHRDILIIILILLLISIIFKR